MGANFAYETLLASVMPGAVVALAYLPVFYKYFSDAYGKPGSADFFLQFLAFSILAGFILDVLGHTIADELFLKKLRNSYPKQFYFRTKVRQQETDKSQFSIIQRLLRWWIGWYFEDGEYTDDSWLKKKLSEHYHTTDEDELAEIVGAIFAYYAPVHLFDRRKLNFAFYEAGRNFTVLYIPFMIGVAWSLNLYELWSWGTFLSIAVVLLGFEIIAVKYLWSATQAMHRDIARVVRMHLEKRDEQSAYEKLVQQEEDWLLISH